MRSNEVEINIKLTREDIARLAISVKEQSKVYADIPELHDECLRVYEKCIDMMTQYENSLFDDFLKSRQTEV